MIAAPTTRVAVWDIPVRLFHWTLVALLAFSWWSGERHEMEWHRLSGYGILTLLIFRIYWGFVGGWTARFGQFVRGPRAALVYVRSLAREGYEAEPGHNPIGGWSVLAMLLALGAMVVAGLFSVDVDGFESGPLADYVTFEQGRAAAHAHGFLFDIILALVALHIAAVLFYLLRHRRNLIGAMIHGRQRLPETASVPPLGASAWKAVVGIAFALACAYAAAQGFRL